MKKNEVSLKNEKGNLDSFAGRAEEPHPMIHQACDHADVKK